MGRRSNRHASLRNVGQRRRCSGAGKGCVKALKCWIIKAKFMRGNEFIIFVANGIDLVQNGPQRTST